MPTVYCQKLNQEGEALDFAPYPGELGDKIQQSICQQAWSMWLGHQTMLINEYRLNLLEPEARTFLKEEMQKFLFEGGSEKPAGFIPKNKKNA